jgi:Fe-Mn family superoxide dismutase
MTFTLPALPFEKTDLEPYISSNTIDFHYGKHHQAYVTNLNNLITGTEWENKSLEEIILESAKDPTKMGIFNNAAQVWNHTFYWNCLKKNGGGEPSSKLMDLIRESFGDFEKFKAEFKQAALTQFGSGWAWLILEDGKLQIFKTSNADLPLAHGKKALLTCDVWEHAYYLDYQNKRPDYVDTFLNHLINWDFVQSNL